MNVFNQFNLQKNIIYFANKPRNVGSNVVTSSSSLLDEKSLSTQSFVFFE